ncbi:ciliary microtubule inner protein 5 [Sphaeramia orbicularis]|uniref:ciliary microtubule inner protein 5 n=1 Tax=Sphaeramia orbicularis TaxID=375764 RepID=UPI00118124C8|nr:uncharacterized protein C2orf50 homolog [Sphaeramia orbicularis]
MELNNARRASSAGYRLPERSNGTRPRTTQAPAAKMRYTQGEPVPVAHNSDRDDPVKQDQIWRELVWNERRRVQEWEKNWNFLRNYDQLGQWRSEEPLPSYVSLFSDRIPNTSNQMLGSRLSTSLGNELVRLDRLLLWSDSHRKRKQDPEMLPC